MNIGPKGYLGLDVGGTGAKAGVFDRDGRLLGFGHRTYEPVVTVEGQAEIDIETIYAAARDSAREAIQASGVRIAALAVSSQGQTFVSLDGANRPLHRAILWYDSRAREEAEELQARVIEAGHGEPVPGIEIISSAPKIIWLRKRHPEAMAPATRYLLLPEYFSYRLTGESVTDPSTACSTGLYVEDPPGYSSAALAAAEIELSQVANVLDPGTPIGRIKPAMAEEWGLPVDSLLVTGTNDQYAGALGAGNNRTGIVTATVGTCLALVTLTRAKPGNLAPGLFPGRFPIPPYWFLLAFAKTAGLVLDWFRRELSPGLKLEDLESQAAQSPPGSLGVTVLPHFDGVISPVPNPNARGAFCNLTLQHTRGDMYRAILESLAFSLRDNLELLVANGFPVDIIRSIGGGARSALWLQINADVTGMPVERPSVTEAAVLGAAMLAAYGNGDFSSLEGCSSSFYRIERVFIPNPDRREGYQSAYQRYQTILNALC
jgi:xylulokinase